jgi:hypothetical protein
LAAAFAKTASPGMHLGCLRGRAGPVSSGFLTGGIFPLPFTSRSKTWGEPAAARVADRLVVDASNVASVTSIQARARVSCDAAVVVVVVGPEPVQVELNGCKPPCRKSVPAHGRDGRPPGLCRPRR